MYNKRNSYNSHGIKNLIILSILIIETAYSENNFKNVNGYDKVKNVIIKYEKQFEYLQQINWRWPDSNLIKTNTIDKDKIPEKSVNNAMHWVRYYLNNIDGLCGNEIFLCKMSKGDDWIINRISLSSYYIFNGYLQYIDSRYLDVIFTMQIDTDNIDYFKSNFLKKINSVIKVENIVKSNNSEIIINRYSDGVIKGQIDCANYNYYCRLPEGKRKPEFWTNGEIVVISLPKVRTPFRDRFGYWGERTIGGIKRNDERKFVRFNTLRKVDFEQEMLKEFPWVKDSLDFWKNKKEQYLPKKFMDYK